MMNFRCRTLACNSELMVMEGIPSGPSETKHYKRKMINKDLVDKGLGTNWEVKREALRLVWVTCKLQWSKKKKSLNLGAHTESLNLDYGFPSTILRLKCTREKQGPPFHLLLMSFGEGG